MTTVAQLKVLVDELVQAGLQDKQIKSWLPEDERRRGESPWIPTDLLFTCEHESERNAFAIDLDPSKVAFISIHL